MALNENALKWIDALRSGEYTQGRSNLRTNYKYCCLGVACDLYAKETGKGSWKPQDNNYPGIGTIYDFVPDDGESTSFFLPRVVADWLGIRSNYAEFLESGVHSDLPGINDSGVNGEEADFRYIADLIESEPEGLFV